MAEKGGTTALSAYKAGEKSAHKPRKKQNVFYFPLGRTLSTVAGVLKMVNPGNIKLGVDALMSGAWNTAGHRLGAMFDGGDFKGGTTLIATGIVIGKALDYTKTNPRLKMGKYGIKLV